MAALKEILDEQARIKAELQRMEDDETVTEENDGDLRDTLIARWEELDIKSKPIIERMTKIRGITDAAGDEANLERPDDTGYDQNTERPGGGPRYAGSPELVTRRHTNPYAEL